MTDDSSRVSSFHQVVQSPWMSDGLLVQDRGYPRCFWPTFFMVGNHKIYKRFLEYPGGYPYLLAKQWRKEVRYTGVNLHHSAIPVPGLASTWWVPPWMAKRYLEDLDKIWDKFMADAVHVATHRKRYDSLKESHRKWHIAPWIRKELHRNYPNHDSMVSLGFPEDREAMVQELSFQSLANYPSPQQLVDGVADSRPAIWQATPSPAAGRYSIWTPYRVRTMAVTAADKYSWVLYMSLRRIAAWMTPSRKTGRYAPLLPVDTLKKARVRNRRLAEWDGPGHDSVLFAAVDKLVSDIMAVAGPRLSNTAPSNPWRRHFLVRTNHLIVGVTDRRYKAAKVDWWCSGDPGTVPTIPAPRIVPVSVNA